MSFAGIQQFESNLRKVMASPAFKAADDSGKLNIGWRLLNSKYGFGSFLGFGRVAELKTEE